MSSRNICKPLNSKITLRKMPTTSTQISDSASKNNKSSVVLLPSNEIIDENSIINSNKNVQNSLNVFELKLQQIEEIAQKKESSITISTKQKITAVSKFFNSFETSTNSDEDFDSRAKLKTPVKRLQKPAKKVAVKKPRKQRDIRSMIKNTVSVDQIMDHVIDQHSKEEEFDPEQLKMALAISKSLSDSYVQEKKAQKEEQKDETGITLSQKYSKVKRTLEGYGFKCKTSYADYDLATLFGPNRTRKISFKPTLLTKRSKERQEQLLAERIQLLLNDEYKENVAVPIQLPYQHHCHSLHLEPMAAIEKPVYHMSQNDELLTNCLDKYYSSKLFPTTTVRADYLLQDWNAIHGRSRTPSPTNQPFETPLKLLKDPNSPIRESLETKDQYPIQGKQVSRIDQEKNIGNEKKSYSNDDQAEQIVETAELIVIDIQSKLDDLHSNLASQSSLAKSCEDLFADSDDDIMHYDIQDSDDGKK